MIHLCILLISGYRLKLTKNRLENRFKGAICVFLRVFKKINGMTMIRQSRIKHLGKFFSWLPICCYWKEHTDTRLKIHSPGGFAAVDYGGGWSGVAWQEITCTIVAPYHLSFDSL